MDIAEILSGKRMSVDEMLAQVDRIRRGLGRNIYSALSEPIGIAGITDGGTLDEARFGYGNIDLMRRPKVRNLDGSISTLRSVSVNIGGKEVLLPTVTDDGRIESVDEAVRRYRQTGRHLGMFDTPEQANAYAKQLHEDQAKMLGRE